jgi:hypothetical protein
MKRNQLAEIDNIFSSILTASAVQSIYVVKRVLASTIPTVAVPTMPSRASSLLIESPALSSQRRQLLDQFDRLVVIIVVSVVVKLVLGMLPVWAWARSFTENDNTIGTAKAAPRTSFLSSARLPGSTVRSARSSLSSPILFDPRTRRRQQF